MSLQPLSFLYFSVQLGTQQAAQTTAQQQQKVTYATTTQLQPGIKTQFFTTSIAQPQKPATAQQIQVRSYAFTATTL